MVEKMVALEDGTLRLSGGDAGQLAEKLVGAGLDRLTVSIDGVNAEGNADVRSGADLNAVLRNVEQLQQVRVKSPRDAAQPPQ